MATFDSGSREGTEAHRVEEEVLKRKQIAKDKGVPELIFQLYFKSLVYFPKWIESYREGVPTIVESAQSESLGEKEVVTVAFSSKTYRFEFTTRSFSTPDSDCESGLLELFADRNKLFGIKAIRTLRMWDVDPEMAAGLADSEWSVVDISAFIDGDWIEDFRHLREAIQDAERLRQIRAAEDPKKVQQLKRDFGISEESTAHNAAPDTSEAGAAESPQNPATQIRILVSERENWFVEHIVQLAKSVTEKPIAIEAIVPRTIREDELLYTAARQKFDFAVLFLNNISYLSGNRGRVADDSVALVRRMIELFGKPVIGVYAYPDSADYPSQVMEAGASAVLRAPFKAEDMRQAIKRCIDNCSSRAEAAQHIAEIDRSKQSQTLGKQRVGSVLATDDNSDFLLLVKNTLEPLGYEVETFSNKVKALEEIQRRKSEFDVVITDLYAPHLDGFKFIEWVKKLNSSIPVIVISGNIGPLGDNDGEKARRAMELGAFECMQKPFKISDLVQLVDRAMKSRASKDEV
jgi:CheY-like chemotaxis protein